MSDLNSRERVEWPARAVVTAGMPYGNKPLHFGHIGGVFVPADAFARFLRDRIGAENVRFVSGTDCFGSPINEGYRKLKEAGEFEGSIADYVLANHERQKATLEAFQVSLDIYEGSGIGHAGVHDGLADGAQGQGSQLDVLPGEGDADDCHGAGQGREQMAAGDPDTAEQQPDDIAHGAQRAGADVAFAGKDVTGDRHAAEGHEGETGHDEAGPAPGDADDADEAEHARDAPEQAGTQTEGKEPEDIAETAQSLHGKLLKKRGWSIHATRGRDACPCAGGGMGEACGEDAAWCGHLPLSIEEEGPHAGWPSGRRPGRIRQ